MTAELIYSKEVKKYNPLPAKEERAYLEKYFHGNEKERKKAFEILTCSNLRFVMGVARKFQYQGIDFEDLVSEGNLGLIIALKKYNLNSKVRLMSFAVWWIRQTILLAIHNKARLVRIPANRVQAAERETVISIYDKSEGSELTVSDFLPDETTVQELDSSFLNDFINVSLTKLDEKQARILKLYYGIDGIGCTLEEISKKFKLSKERIRQVKKVAIKKLSVCSENFL
jgi:RNA polymerase primary sigma factor